MFPEPSSSQTTAQADTSPSPAPKPPTPPTAAGGNAEQADGNGEQGEQLAAPQGAEKTAVETVVDAGNEQGTWARKHRSPRVAIFSRNCETRTVKYTDIATRLPGQLQPGVESVVLDGEVVAYDAENK